MSKILLKFKWRELLLLLVCAAGLAGCGQRRVHTVKVEAEANQIIDVLGENGIRATKEEIGEGERKSFQIMVRDDEALAGAIQLMEDHCLGRPDPPEPEGGAVITSTEVERAREMRRMKMNIESQLRKLPGVTCVEVNFVPPQDRSMSITPYVASASVLINYKTAAFPFAKDEIALAVARSVPDLKPELVTAIIAPKPLRPLPENKTGYNAARIGLVSGIGLATVLAFVSVAFVMRKKRGQGADRSEPPDAPAAAAEPPREAALLDDRYDFDDDEEDEENLP